MKKHPKRRRTVFLLAVLAVTASMLAGGAEAAFGGIVCPPPPQDEGEDPLDPVDPPPPPPGHAQQCFEQYIVNQARCFDVCCFDLLWVWHVDCDDACLIDCQSKASNTYDQCMMGH